MLGELDIIYNGLCAICHFLFWYSGYVPVCLVIYGAHLKQRRIYVLFMPELRSMQRYIILKA